MKKYMEMLKSNGADAVKEIDPHSIVTAAWTIYKCQYGCSSYGQNHCCPPKSPGYQQTKEMIACYTKGILFQCHHWGVTDLAVKVARELFLDGYYKAIAFGSGPCKRCEICNPNACNFPEKAIPSMEACGIDVFATVRANGFSIHTLKEKGETRNHFGLLLVE